MSSMTSFASVYNSLEIVPIRELTSRYFGSPESIRAHATTIIKSLSGNTMCITARSNAAAAARRGGANNANGDDNIDDNSGDDEDDNAATNGAANANNSTNNSVNGVAAFNSNGVGSQLVEQLLAALSARSIALDKCPRLSKDFGAMMDRYGEAVVEATWRKALLVLLNAEERFAVGDRVLTVFGAWAATIAYNYNFPAAVSHHLSLPALMVDPRVSGVSIHHYSRYFFYLGLMQADYSRFEESCALLETALEVRHAYRVPFAVAANKALLVAAAVARGEIAPQMTYTARTGTTTRRDAEAASSSSQHHAQAVASIGVFAKFAKAYLESPHQITAARQALFGGQRAPAFSSVDGGLARLVELACNDRTSQQILKLTRVYANMPLAEVARSIGVKVEEAKAQLDLLVASGRIGAVVDPTNGFVYFHEVSALSREAVEDSIKRAISLADAMAVAQTKVELSSDYIRSTREFKDRNERDIAMAAAH